MATIKQQLRYACVHLMNEIGHRWGGMGAVDVVKAGGVPFHVLEHSANVQADWVLSFVGGRAVVTVEDLLGMLGRMSVHLGRLSAQVDTLPEAGANTSPVGSGESKWSIHEQLRALLHDRVESLIDGGETLDSVANMAGVASYSLERMIDTLQVASFSELEEASRMLDIELLLTGKVAE